MRLPVGTKSGRDARAPRGALLAFLASAVVLAVLLALLWWEPRPEGVTPGTQPLTVYCAAGLKAPVEAVAREYQERYGVPVRLQYGGSQTLLANLEVARDGDLYLPGDDSYLEAARGKGLVAETIPLARMTPVLAVPAGNPRKLHSLDDVLREGVRVSEANPDAAAVGKLTREALQQAGRWDAFRKRVVVSKTTVNDVATDVQVGAADAGVVWDAIVRQSPGLEMVRLPELEGHTAHVSVGVLRRSEQPTAALRFARYLSAGDRGLLRFAEQGFDAVEGDPWEEEPELRLLAGAMLRPAVEATIEAFERREGVRVTRVYNGCGILVAQMRAAGQDAPDAYFACDRSFMTQVHDLFLEPVAVSSNRLVILVPRGNPHHVESLDDLGKPGLRVGVGHEKQCALGALTQETLRQGKAHGRVMANVKVQTPTGDMLVNQLLTGSLDAVIAYVSNAAGQGDRLEAIPIDVPCAVAVQPIAVARQSRHKQLARRLVEAVRSQQSRQHFEAQQFLWGAAQ